MYAGAVACVLWFGSARADSCAELGQYLERRMAKGLLRPMPDPKLAARVVTESVAWFAWHRREGRDSALYDDRTARRTVIEFACAALVAQSAPVINSRAPAPVPETATSRGRGQ